MEIDVRNGGTYHKVTTLAVKVAGVWHNCVSGWVRTGGVWQQFFSAAAPSSNYNGLNGSRINSLATATCIVTFVTDGSVTITGTGTGGSPTSDWYLPHTAGAGNSYWIKLVSVTGDALFSGLTVGAVTALSSNQTCTLRTTSTQVKSTSLVLSIYSDAGGTTQVATGTVTLNCDST